MNKKEKFIKLVELESRMNAINRNYREYVTKNTHSAMFVDEECIPDEKGNNELYNAVREFVGWKMRDKDRPDWLEYKY